MGLSFTTWVRPKFAVSDSSSLEFLTSLKMMVIAQEYNDEQEMSMNEHNYILFIKKIYFKFTLFSFFFDS